MKKYNGIIFFLVIIATLLSIPRIIVGLTPVDKLTNKYLHSKYERLSESSTINVNVLTKYLHEESKYKARIGAICNDGWISNSTGRGTCSHHGGVSTWRYQEGYSKSIEVCQQEAELSINKIWNKANELSWLE